MLATCLSVLIGVAGSYQVLDFYHPYDVIPVSVTCPLQWPPGYCEAMVKDAFDLLDVPGNYRKLQFQSPGTYGGNEIRFEEKDDLVARTAFQVQDRVVKKFTTSISVGRLSLHHIFNTAVHEVSHAIFLLDHSR